jgi:glutamate N-acetyltransferase / amino-acid N-acetyltransferase
VSDLRATRDPAARASGKGRMTGRPSGSLEAEHAAGIGSFFRSRWVEAPAGTEEVDPAELAPEFRAGAVACGLKPSGATDVALLTCDAERVDSVLLLTRNAAAAAPVRVCRDECDRGAIRAAVVNSGNANAATGEQGYRDALAMRDAAAGELALDPRSVAVAETGTIGVPLQIGQVEAGIVAAAGRLDESGARSFAEAIMTTDATAKLCTVRCDGVTVSAQAKGAGMIEPDLATMLCFVQTDAAVPDADAALRAAVADSFERITVDGQMSTNDTVLLQATGTSARQLPEGLLDAVLLQLALEVVADGEGATRVGRIEVTGAADPEEAERVARAIANSPLVKAALHGRDPNWGRIVQAAGVALAGTELPELGPEAVDAAELGVDTDEAEIALRLERGEGRAHVYFSDLTAEYVRINSEYTT